jgi:hypothetical protein
LWLLAAQPILGGAFVGAALIAVFEAIIQDFTVYYVGATGILFHCGFDASASRFDGRYRAECGHVVLRARPQANEKNKVSVFE